MAKDEKKTELTPADMVDVIAGGGSVLCEGTIISEYSKLPPEARRIAGKRLAGEDPEASAEADKAAGEKEKK